MAVYHNRCSLLEALEDTEYTRLSQAGSKVTEHHTQEDSCLGWTAGELLLTGRPVEH